MSTLLSDYDYFLPNELIGQKPTSPRDHSKLMAINSKTESFEHKKFYDILEFLNPGDLLIRNSTKVIPARMIGKKETGAILEIFLLNRIHLNKWECMIRGAKKLKLGQKVFIGNNNELTATLDEIKEDGNRILSFEYNGIWEDVLNNLGEMPLPPYITEKLEDSNRYQTVYAKKGESVAAPTAGLHFTNELLEKIKEKNIEIVDIYLTVGLGTFRPVNVENILDHNMHSEKYHIPKEAADKILKAKKEDRRVIAVGTTSVRAIESAILEDGTLNTTESETNIFIYPGYKFKIVDALITNFHLPKSTLLMLVSAFSNKEFIFKCYDEAIKKKYKFFSFGDSMFIY